MAWQLQAQVNWELKSTAMVMRPSETVLVTYTLENAVADEFTPPAFDDWEILNGPVERSTTLIDNGKKATTQEYSFELQPKHNGKCTVPAAKVVVKNKTYTSNSIVIEVYNRSGGEMPSSASMMPTNAGGFTYDAYVINENENPQNKARENLFLKANLSKTSCFEGEAVVVEYLLFSRVNLDAQVARRPGFPGFSAIDVNPDVAVGDYYYSHLQGKVYKVYPLRKVQLYPLQTGRLVLDPFEVDATVAFLKMKDLESSRHPDLYAPEKTVSCNVTLRSSEAAITVTALPQKGKPAGKAIPVGKFSLRSSVDSKTLSAGQTASLVVEVSGIGQWSMVQLPKVKWPKGITAFEPVSEENIDSQSVPLKGTRNYRFRFTPDSAGAYEIPATSITYFDPSAQQYKEISTEAYKLQVNAAAIVTQPTDWGLNDPENFRLTDWFTKFAPVLMLGAALLLVLVLYAAKKRNKSVSEKDDNENELEMPYAGVVTQVKRREAAAANYSRPETTIVDNASSDTRNLALRMKKELIAMLQSGSNFSEATDILQQKNIAAPLADKVLAFIETCDQVCYSPVPPNVASEKLETDFIEIKDALKAEMLKA